MCECDDDGGGFEGALFRFRRVGFAEVCRWLYDVKSVGSGEDL